MKRLVMKINEVKEILSQDNPNEKILEQLRNDERSGVQKLLASFDKKQEKNFFIKKSTKKNHFMKINVIIKDVNTSVVLMK